MNYTAFQTLFLLLFFYKPLGRPLVAAGTDQLNDRILFLLQAFGSLYRKFRKFYWETQEM